MQTSGRLDYKRALERLLGLVDYERIRDHRPAPPRPDLRRMQALLERLGNPHESLPLVHIAGTKGKGSIAALLASAFVSLGYRSGLFTSPHLHTFRERIRLNREPISEKTFASLAEDCWPALEAVNKDGTNGEVTLFEFLGAMAFSMFAREGCKWGVVEVGLGGRLDSTNVIVAEIVVISSISADHTEILGNTLAQIAREKAGIIKRGNTVVSGPQAPEALEVITQVCEEQGAKFIFVPDHYQWERINNLPSGQAFRVWGPHRSYDMWIPLLGFHQLENATVALAVLESLESQGLSNASEDSNDPPIQEQALPIVEGAKNGFSQVQWPARMEVLAEHPLLIVDGAHNAASLERLLESLREYFSFENLILVVGWGIDKDSTAMAQVVARMEPTTVVVAKSRHPRAMRSNDLADLLRTHNIPVVGNYDKVKEAVKKARNLASAKDLVLSTGSLFVAAETREHILRIPDEIYPEFRAVTTWPH